MHPQTLPTQHREKGVVPNAGAGVRLRGAYGVVGVGCWARRGPRKTAAIGTVRVRGSGWAGAWSRRGNGAAVVSAAGVGCGRYAGSRARRGNGAAVTRAGGSGGRRGGRDCLARGRRTWQGDEHGTEHDHDGGSGKCQGAHVGSFRKRLFLSISHLPLRVSDDFPTRVGGARGKQWQQ